MNFKFTKEHRLLKRNEFLSLKKEGLYFRGKTISIQYKDDHQNKKPRLGVTVQKKSGNSVERNRFKRLAREAFRKTLPHLPKTISCNIFPLRPLNEINLSLIEEDLSFLLPKNQ